MPNAPSIFISYSTQDEAAARKVRNLFEERGHDALLLKLQQRMSEEFIMDLLRNEVKARDWVVMVESPRSQQSDWVAYERAVADIYHKPMYHIDAECANGTGEFDNLQNCLQVQVNRISRKFRVFISYTHRDQAITERIAVALRTVGYETWYDTASMTVGGNIAFEIQNAIDETLERGVMLVLISANSIQSMWVQHELAYGLARAPKLGGRLIPVLIPPASALPLSVAHIQALDMTQDVGLGIEKLLHDLQHAS